MKNSSTSSYSSSKSSSKNSSPSNTLRATGTMLSLTEVLAEAQQLEKIQGVEVLLEDIQYLDLLCRKAEDYDEFPALLFRFFYVHDKTHYLLRWALEKDINSLSPNELFRGETMATRLFYYQFFGDLGRRFVTSILSNMIEEFAALEYSVEIELSRITVPMTTSIDTDANLKWILEKLKKFIGTLVEAADNCPLGLRESFLFLKDVVGNKVENSNVFIASVLFLRLICPCLVAPEEYGIMHNLSVRKLTPHAKRGLIIASKILQSAANNYMWEERPGSQMVNQFITESNPLIVEFASKLTDTDTIALGKKMVKASMTPISKEEIHLCHQNLKQFINIHILKKRVQSEVDFEQKINMATTMSQSKQWKICHQAKKENCEYSISQLKQEGSNLVAFRYAAKFKAKFELVREYIRTNPEMASIDERVQLNQVIERHSETHFDTYWLLKAQFPVSARDLVYTSHQFDETPDRWTQITYSIDRDDKPPTKCIRAIINLMYYLVERDPTDPESTLYTYIFHMDLKGWIPAMLINNNSKMSFNSLTKIAKNVMSLGKPEEVVDKKKKKKKEDKAILKEKSGN